MTVNPGHLKWRRVLQFSLMSAAVLIAGPAASGDNYPPKPCPPKEEARPLCVETHNPHGQTVPPAGSTTLPGPNGGQNDDGFYRVGTDTGVAVDLFDEETGFFFGTFANGSDVKYTEANGADPGVKDIGSNNGNGNGQAGAVEAHLNGQGDLLVCVTGTDTCITCFVPPPPK